MIHVTLKNKKVYIAILEHADLNVNLVASEMTFSIIPVLSGYRRNEDLRVVYIDNYTKQVRDMIGMLHHHADEHENTEKDQLYISREYEALKRIFRVEDIESIGLYNETYGATALGEFLAK